MTYFDVNEDHWLLWRFHLCNHVVSDLPSSLKAQSALLAAPGARVVTITPAGHTGSEPSIALNFRNPAQLIATAGEGMLAYSTDSARTFTVVNPSANGGHTGGDPSVVYDDRRNAFFVPLLTPSDAATSRAMRAPRDSGSGSSLSIA